MSNQKKIVYLCCYHFFILLCRSIFPSDTIFLLPRELATKLWRSIADELFNFCVSDIFRYSEFSNGYFVKFLPAFVLSIILRLIDGFSTTNIALTYQTMIPTIITTIYWVLAVLDESHEYCNIQCHWIFVTRMRYCYPHIKRRYCLEKYWHQQPLV